MPRLSEEMPATKRSPVPVRAATGMQPVSVQPLPCQPSVPMAAPFAGPHWDRRAYLRYCTWAIRAMLVEVL